MAKIIDNKGALSSDGGKAEPAANTSMGKKQRFRSPVRSFRSLASKINKPLCYSTGIGAQISNVHRLDGEMKVITLKLDTKVDQFRMGQFVCVRDGRCPPGKDGNILEPRTFHVLSNNSNARTTTIIARSEADANSMSTFLYARAEIGSRVSLS